MIKEACVEGFAQAFRAQESGADRIELCENLDVGGTTPSIGTVIMCKKVLKIPTIVMIRPRGGNFIYTDYETELMSHDIEACRNAGADGIAIGLLNAKNEIDIGALLKLLKKAGKMQVTFHKAIDSTQNIEKEFIRLRDSGLVARVLTSGGAPDAISGAAVLNKLFTISERKINIVVAGKVSNQNLQGISSIIPAKEFHGKKIVGNLSGY
jgi:copper homeostasis protein